VDNLETCIMSPPPKESPVVLHHQGVPGLIPACAVFAAVGTSASRLLTGHGDAPVARRRIDESTPIWRHLQMYCLLSRLRWIPEPMVRFAGVVGVGTITQARRSGIRRFGVVSTAMPDDSTILIEPHA